MHIAIIHIGKKKLYCVVHEGGASDVTYDNFKDAEDAVKKLKRLKNELFEQDRLARLEYDEERETPRPEKFLIFERIVGGELAVILIGPLQSVKVFRGKRALEAASAEAWRSISPNSSRSSDFRT